MAGSLYKNSYNNGKSSSIQNVQRDEKIEIYRSVSNAEYNSIKVNKKFVLLDGAMENKQFGFNMDEVKNFGTFFGQDKIITVEISNKYLKLFDNTHVDKLIFTHRTLSINKEMLDFFNSIIKIIW